MATDPKKRQKKLEKRAAKRKEKKHLIVREQSAGLPGQLTAAANFPVLDCWIGNSLEDQGIGWVVLSREFPDSRVAVATFLVDRYALGVKNVVCEIMGRASYNNKYPRKMHSDMPSRRAAPAEARKLLEEAVTYAHGIGLAPHPDYPKALLLFGSVDPAESDAKFEFGKDGKPLFIAGPNDTPARSRRIIAILTNACGPDGFHYIIPLAPSGQVQIIGGEAGDDDEFHDEEESGGPAQLR